MCSSDLYGAVGGASVWLILNIGYFLFEIPILHNRLLKKEKWRWYWKDICLPLISSISVAGLGRLLISGHFPNYIMIQYLIILFVFASFLASIIVPVTRFFLFKQLTKITLFLNKLNKNKLLRNT